MEERAIDAYHFPSYYFLGGFNHLSQSDQENMMKNCYFDRESYLLQAYYHKIMIKMNPFRSVPDFLITLWLTPDDFARQGEMCRTGKG